MLELPAQSYCYWFKQMDKVLPTSWLDNLISCNISRKLFHSRELNLECRNEQLEEYIHLAHEYHLDDTRWQDIYTDYIQA